MKAVIMAGGQGSRLRPLTCTLPKPMARLCGRPILEYILDLLDRHGVTEAAVTLGYLPQAVTAHFPQRRYKGISLEFFEEDEPLGTAGSVRNAWREEDGEVLVISGDALCDFDLTAALRFHHASGARATLAVKRVEDPREYGLVCAEADGRITGFVEKPSYSQAVSEYANTGIYLLSPEALRRIPQQRRFDFARDLFAEMLAEGEALYAWEAQGYWCDIGEIGAYLRCQRDLLEQKVRSTLRFDASGNVVHPAARLQPGCTLRAPVYIGEGAVVETGAVVEAGSVIDCRAVVARQARVSGSVLLPGARLGYGGRATGALLCAGSAVKTGGALFEGAVLGERSVLGAHGEIRPGILVWPEKILPDGAVVQRHFKTGASVRGIFEDDGIFGELGVELTPEFCARLGAALGSAQPQARIGVGHGAGNEAQALAAALCAGIRSTGSTAVDFGECFGSMFRFFLSYCAFPLGAYLEGGEPACIRIFSEGAMPPARALERTVEGAFQRGEFLHAQRFGNLLDFSAMKPLYTSELLALGGDLSQTALQVRCSNRTVRRVLEDVLTRLGCDVGQGDLAELSPDGTALCLQSAGGHRMPHVRLLALGALAEFRAGNDAALRYDAPRAIDELAAAYGRRLLRYCLCPADGSDRQARVLAARQRWPVDGLALCVHLLRFIRQEQLTLAQADALLPAFGVEQRGVPTAGNPAALLARLDAGVPADEGVWVHGEKASALLRPFQSGRGIRVFAEAVSTELASEFCDDLIARLSAAQDVLLDS